MGTLPKGVEVKAPYGGKRVWLGRSAFNWMGDAEIDLSMGDFCFIVEYVMTNTDLNENDPRIKLQKKVAGMRIVAGFNDDGHRFECAT